MNNSNTQGSGGAGTGSGSGSGSGAGTGTGNGGSGTGPGRRAALVFLLACVVTGLALATTPLASEYTNPDIRMAAYLMAGVVLYATATYVIARPGRRA